MICKPLQNTEPLRGLPVPLNAWILNQDFLYASFCKLFRCLVLLFIFLLKAYIALHAHYMFVFHSLVLVIIACSSEIKYANNSGCCTSLNSSFLWKADEKFSPRGKG